MILITAAGGKVGQHVAEQLSKKGIPARAGFHSEAKAKALKLPGIEGVVLDLDKPESIAAALKGVDKVFLVAMGSPEQARQEGNVIAEAKKANVKRIVKVSVMGAEAERTSFARWNRAAEKELEASGIPWTILRPNMFMQNLLGMAGLIKEKGGFTQGPETMKMSPIDARDIAAMGVAALTEEGHIGKKYDVAGPETLDLKQQAAILSKVIGKPVQYWNQSPEELTKSLAGFGMPSWLVSAYGDMTTEYSTSNAAVVSSADVEKVLHRKPGSLEQFARDYVQAFK